LQRCPSPLSGCKGPTSKGKGREKREGKGKGRGRERHGRGGEGTIQPVIHP